MATTTTTIGSAQSGAGTTTTGALSLSTAKSTGKVVPKYEPKEIECWGHRGASAHLPENTLASFRAAILEGANAIESDVHATSDGVVLMFHDPTLDRTTTGKGLIREQPWKGVIEHVKTIKEPVQSIPLFSELIALLMEPENQHVSLNIDCKMQNDPARLFPEMARIISQYDNYETLLAPRLILGLWHPLFIVPALTHLPLLRRYHIGFSIAIAKEYFWDACEGFSLAFAILMTQAGQDFVKKCREAGKEICVWTVNHPDEMRMAMQWGVKAVLTDKVGAFVQLQKEVIQDPAKLQLGGIKGSLFGWSSWRYYSLAHVGIKFVHRYWVSAHGSLPSLSDPSTTTQLDELINAAQRLKSDTSKPVRNDTTPGPSTPAVDDAAAAPSESRSAPHHSVVSDDTPVTGPMQFAPQRKQSISESIMTWVDTTAAHGAERLFNSR